MLEERFKDRYVLSSNKAKAKIQQFSIDANKTSNFQDGNDV